MSQEPAAMTMTQRIHAMIEWAQEQIGKHKGPIAIGPGVTIIDPDKFIGKQLETMAAYKPRDLMHTSSYMHLYKFKIFIENREDEKI